MHTKIEIARTYLYKVCRMANRNKPFSKEAVLRPPFRSCTVGYGLMEEYDVERFWRDHRLLRIGERNLGNPARYHFPADRLHRLEMKRNEQTAKEHP
jgi:hypothetical protein